MLAELKQIAHERYNKLVEEYPRQKEHGGQLFLGKHYASGNILFLGLAPMIDDSSEFNADLSDSNILLDGNGNAKRRFFNNAAHAFKQNEVLRARLENATFCYCCPFKTKRWPEVSKLRQKLFLDHSRPILNTIIEHCKPEYIIVSGNDTVDVLSDHFGDMFTDLHEIDHLVMDRSHHWVEYLLKVNNRPTVLLKTPNFTYASNKKKLFHLSNWLYEKTSRSPYGE